MQLTIRARFVLAMNLLVVGVGVAAGWIGIAVTSRGVEQRLVDEPAANAAGLFETLSLPLSWTMTERLSQILGSDVVAAPAADPAAAVGSLPDYEQYTFTRRLARGEPGRRVVIGEKAYLVGRSVVENPAGPEAGPVRLYVLAAESEVRAAQREATRSILWVTLAAVVVATGLGVWLAATISRPVRRLADRMQRLTERAERGEIAAGEPAGRGRAAPGPEGTSGGPAEVRVLAGSFETLLSRLAEARDRMARAERLATLGKVAASVAHELRNPLSGIRMNAQLLAGDLGEADEAGESLRRIIRETDRMDLYLGEMLGLGRPPDAAAEAEPAAETQREVLRLEEVAESVLVLVEGRCRHAGVDVRREWADDAPPVRAEEVRVRQVILNLLLNALDASGAGGTVTLATRQAEAGGVRFEVTDMGPGVHVPGCADPFEPFVTSKPDGIGLGLYVCRRNVEALGGRIGYKAAEAGGTTFWFELLAAEEP
jgi:signal transduction histidine kinase